MLVYGGVDEFDNILNDIWILDLNNLIWTRIDVLNNKIMPFLVFHSSTLVLKSEKKNHPLMNIFKFPEPKLKNINRFENIKNEGVYVFGGKDKLGKYTNEIRIIKIGKPNLEFINCITTGIPPSARISSSINFSEEFQFCVVFGGKNEKDIILKDIFILLMDTFIWIEVRAFDQLPKRTCEHSSAFYNDTKLIIFGGINTLKYIGSDIYMIDFGIYCIIFRNF